jgi:DNA-binding NtrC family response regulator
MTVRAEAPDPARTVLLVDDNQTIVRAVEFGLRRYGFHVLSATNGQDALAILQSPQPIDLMLSDVVMPGGISGLELARSCHTLRPGVAILLTTGYAYDVMTTLGARENEFEMVTKPYSVSALVLRINQLVPPPGG